MEMGSHLVTARLVWADQFRGDTIFAVEPLEEAMRWADCPNSLFSLVQNVLKKCSKLYPPTTGAIPCLRLRPTFDPAFLAVPSGARL